MVLGKSPEVGFMPEKSPLIKFSSWKIHPALPCKIATNKILTKNIPTISLIAFLNSLIISLIILREGNSV